ncbi:PREDICTED: agamous-like MADS-box protein AGL53 [Camelina sativa]|uniref:Agamous-like MADS-box protein AGL53 n=1 Tax=Camelina sativa TaxID=90675 RepID=A0ABM0Y4I8_CAMSA|nr:PREDICTED: agamous-like MADS-box protein AGL53 [Camelina sativa]
MYKKASELSILCDVEVCVIYYNRDGELVGTWPEDRSKVRDMAERYSKLNDSERRKKSTNLSLFLNKKTDKKTSLDINDKRFSEKLLEMEASLESNIRVLQDQSSGVTEPADRTPRSEPFGVFRRLLHNIDERWCVKNRARPIDAFIDSTTSHGDDADTNPTSTCPL